MKLRSSSLKAVKSVSCAAALAVLTFSAGVKADPQFCIAENEKAGTLRSQGKLAEAKKHFLACSAADCPDVVRNECVNLTDKVEASIPTVVFAVVDPQGKDVSDADLYVDDSDEPETLDGRAIPLNPGSHRVRVTASEGRTNDQQIVALEGEKNRLIRIELRTQKPVEKKPEKTVEPSSSDHTPYIWIAGGVAGVGLASFGLFAAMGKQKQHDLETGCAPNCSTSKVDAMYRDYLIADISLAVAAVAAGVGTYLLVTNPSSEEGSPKQAALPLRLKLGSRALRLDYETKF